jgi:hypothetical protein
MDPADSTLSFPFGELPDEVLLVIISVFDITRGFLQDDAAEAERQMDNKLIAQTLHSLTLTCRRFAAIATPRLYECFIQDRHNTGAGTCFLRTLVEKPALAPCIQYVEDHLIHSHVAHVGRKNAPVELDSTEVVQKQMKLVATANWNLPDMDSILQHNDGLPSHIWDFTSSQNVQRLLWAHLNLEMRGQPKHFAIIAIVLLAKNLCEFAASSPRQSLIRILTFKRFQDSGFRRLWLKIAGSDTRNSWDLSISNKSGLPVTSIQKFLLRYHANMQIGVEGDMGFDELSFDIENMRPQGLYAMVVSSSSLKHFSCRWKSVPERLVGSLWHQPNLETLRQILSKYTTSLESLKIFTLDREPGFGEIFGITPWHSLPQFTSLKHLHVPALMIWQSPKTWNNPDPQLASILPESLETLTLEINWVDETEEALYKFLSGCSDSRRSLVKIELICIPISKAVADGLVDAYKEKGFKLSLPVSTA